MTTRATFKGVLESARGGGHVVPVDEPAVAAIGGTHMRRVKGTIEDMVEVVLTVDDDPREGDAEKGPR